MGNDKILSICIPTYNRANILDEALADLIPKITTYNIEIVITDNASTDNTIEVVKKHQAIYNNILFYRNQQNLGSDRNFAQSLLHSSSDYIWILGDSFRINVEFLSRIIELLNTGEFNAVVMNSDERVKNIHSGPLSNAIELFDKMGWHMTLLATFIFSKEFVILNNLERYYNTNFIHVGLFFEHLTTLKEFKVYWTKENIVYSTSLSKGTTYWQINTFKVFGQDWFGFVMSLPNQIPIDSKLKCIKAHAINTRIFSIRNLYFLKSIGGLSKEKVFPYRKYCCFITNTPWWIIYLLILIPFPLLKAVKTLCKKLF